MFWTFFEKLSALLVIIWGMSYQAFAQEVKEPALNFRLDVKITFKGFHNNLDEFLFSVRLVLELGHCFPGHNQ